MGDVPQPQPIPDSEEVEINIKNPARSSAPEFKVKVPVSATVADLKARLQRDYTGNPHPSLQTIIYAGRVLKEDSVVLRQILTQGLEGAQCVHSMHLVVKELSFTAAAVSTAVDPPAGLSGPPQAVPQPAARPASSPMQPAAGSSGPSAQAAPAYTQFGAFPMFGSAAYQQPHAVAFQGQQQGPAYVRYQSNPYVQNPAMTAAYNAALAALQNANVQTQGPSSSLPGSSVPGSSSTPATRPQPAVPGATSTPPPSSSAAPAAGNGQQHVVQPGVTSASSTAPLAADGPTVSSAAPSSSGSAPSASGASTSSAQPPASAIPSPATAAASGPVAQSHGPPLPQMHQLGAPAAGPAMMGYSFSMPAQQPVLTMHGMPLPGMQPAAHAAHGGGQVQGMPSAPHIAQQLHVAQQALAAHVAAQQQHQLHHHQHHHHPQQQPPQHRPQFFANPYAAAPGFAYLPYGWVPQGGQVVPVATLPYGFYPVPQQLPFGMPMQLQMQMQLPYAVHAAHAMQTGQGAPVPPPGAQQGLRRRLWGTAQPAAQNGAPAPAAVAARVRGPVRVHMIRINLRVLLQLLVVCVILWQHVPPNRFLFLLAVGAALYLLAFSPLRHVLQRFTGLLPPVNPPPPAPAGPAAAAPAGAAANGAPQQPAPAHAAAAARGAAPFGFVREIYAIIVGFFTSLLPGWNLNAEDAAAFAAAQQMVAREEAAAAAADAGNNNAADAPAAQAAAVGDADRPHQE